MNCANHPDRERTAFCQNCGKPLCTECTRTVGSAVYCEPCLAARLAGGPVYSAGPSGNPYSYSGPSLSGIIPPVPPGEPNPGLAALLGFIPGVGAMYNGQYAKGIVHLIVFAILVTLSNNNGIFGLFIAGWVFYMVIEAHHTARARRDGTPLPNPFGLNDIGDRFGFGRSWPSAQPSATPASQAGPAAYPGSAAGTYPSPAADAPPANWGAPSDSYVPPAASYVPPPAAAYAYGSAPVPPYGTAPIPPYGSAPIPPYGAAPVPPYGSVPVSSYGPYGTVPTDKPYVPQPSRFPAGAIWLIALGTLFLIGNIGWVRGFPVEHLVPIFLIALGLWIFYRKMAETGPSLADDGTPGYRYRLSAATRGSGWLILVGIIYLLNDYHILYWHQSWPLFLIFAGLMIFLRRTVDSHPGYAYTAPPVTPTTQPASTSIVPARDRDEHEPEISRPSDQEGR